MPAEGPATSGKINLDSQLDEIERRELGKACAKCGVRQQSARNGGERPILAIRDHDLERRIHRLPRMTFGC